MHGLLALMALVILITGILQGTSIGHGLGNQDRFRDIVYRLNKHTMRSDACHDPGFIHHYLLMLAAYIFPQLTVGSDLSPR